jgi:hypothetical protein
VASEQLEGAQRHRQHLREQRIERFGTTHGTVKSRRGVRLRRNDQVPPIAAGEGVRRGGHSRGR